MENKTELRPCPFCGVDLNASLRYGGSQIRFEHNCRTGIQLKSKYPEIGREIWNSAWCWKEIERLEGELKESNSRLFESRDNLKTAIEINAELKSELFDLLERKRTLAGILGSKEKELSAEKAKVERLREFIKNQKHCPTKYLKILNEKMKDILA